MAAVGLHPPESYGLDGFRCVPFDPDRKYDWVRGYSFARSWPVLVPERLAYYGIGDPDEHDAHDPMFVLETSNGGATGVVWRRRYCTAYSKSSSGMPSC